MYVGGTAKVDLETKNGHPSPIAIGISYAIEAGW